jgi:flavin reductase (DIM6/NTAB) family NADH-FMN oxidoreductase RutF
MVDSNLNDVSTVYEKLTETLVPQSVAWISTRGIEEADHLTPFVFFGIVSFEPPVIALSTVGAGFTVGGDGGTIEFDSAVARSDIYTTEEFVVNLPTDSTVSEIHSSIQRHGQSSDFFESSRIEREPARRVTPPRLTDTILVIECELRDDIAFGESSLLIGNIVAADVHDTVVDEKLLTVEGFFSEDLSDRNSFQL